jgi:hypothetical protein
VPTGNAAVSQPPRTYLHEACAYRFSGPEESDLPETLTFWARSGRCVSIFCGTPARRCSGGRSATEHARQRGMPAPAASLAQAAGLAGAPRSRLWSIPSASIASLGTAGSTRKQRRAARADSDKSASQRSTARRPRCGPRWRRPGARIWANAIVSHALSCDEDGKALGRQSSSQLSAARESKAIARVTRAFRAERVRSLLDRECLWFRQRRTEQNRRTQVAAAASARAASSAVTAGGSGGSP